ncbi:hypothetical protein IX317_000115 [Fusobacterium sp. DD29]|uniref:hypothetical protein n=1 Tax=unclassified Fusobacterium TaxID=2648384 RepID=UPI001B8C73E7|nr:MULTISPECIES: hypothetical protein [unclassified Fusobacterium]MBR8700327.1 hypothetical protein [Fusobacterium sp. DD45]MBR8710020.1 hypothetical protein [Fusobacterium sp. DD28]MBR8748456.1 hypothetical protein [Fusobacterium sp. DD29]MBR8750580.1 hypothetical protein [Fusobacterium sp. DD26]MBR8760723.1 hypothetical protein [Fusobacterium sp. DD25]
MKKILVTLLMVFTCVVAFAHAPLLSVDDNDDGTIYIEGGFSNGASAEGVECIIVKDRAYNGPEDTFNGKEIIYKGKFGKDNSITIPKPLTPKYEVYFNGGEDHVLGKKGPKLEEKDMEKWKKAVADYDFGDWKESMTEK